MAEYQAYALKEAARRKSAAPESKAPAGSESTLHDAIVAYCRGAGIAYAHGSMATKTHRTPGEPDFWIVYGGRVVPVECKRKDGKLSPDQVTFHHMCQRNGVTVRVVRSFKEFLAAIEPPEKTNTHTEGTK